MRIRFSLRHVLIATSLVACCCAWFAVNTVRRQSEIRSVRNLGEVAGTKVFVGDGEHPFGGCGTWFDGIIVHIDDFAPRAIKPLKLDCTKRVTSIEMKCRNDVALFEVVSKFPHLQSLYVQRRTAALDPDEGIDPFTEALIAFCNSHPGTEVVFWGDED